MAEPISSFASRMKIIRRRQAETVVDAALERRHSRPFFKLPFAPTGRAYYHATNGVVSDDLTFVIEHGGNILCAVECDNASGVLGRFGLPIEACLDSALPYDLRRQAVIEICAELRRLAAEYALKETRVRSAAATDPGGIFLGYLLRHGAQAELELRAVIDLRLSEQALVSDLRKGHRQQVRWGNANLTWSFVDCSSFDSEKLQSYRAFHAEIAGRVTRGPESWAAMHQAIATGHGDLVLGHYDGKLVSGTLALDGGDTAYYASGVYRRELFDKPLGHAAVFSAIIRAKARGCRFFDVGELPGPAASEKERAIGYFKEGFTMRTDASIILKWA